MEKKAEKNPSNMPFLDHLEELRWRILKCLASVVIVTAVAFPFTGKLLDLLTRPNSQLGEPAKLIFLKPTGMLVVRMEIALAVGLIASIGVIFYQFWQFVVPGLLQKEKKYFLPSLLFTTICFLIGTGFAYFIVIPLVLPILFSMGTDDIEATINITEYLSFTLRLILVSGLIFELPVLSFFLSRIGVLKPDFLKKYRRYGVVLSCIFAALITPPDPLSMMLMAFPLVILYEISIWIAVIGYGRKKASDEAWEKEFSGKT